MRRVAGWSLSLLMLTVAVAMIASVTLTSRAIAAAEKAPATLCLDDSDATGYAAGPLDMRRKDRIAETSANFALGARTGLWWNLRGILIGSTYRTFWPEAQRRALFDRLASKMRRCPPHAVG